MVRDLFSRLGACALRVIACEVRAQKKNVRVNLQTSLQLHLSLPPWSLTAGLMRDLGVALAPSQLSQAIAQLDTRQCGQVSFGEFLLWWKG